MQNTLGLCIALLIGFVWPDQDPPTTFLFNVAGHFSPIGAELKVFGRDGTGIGLIAQVREESPHLALEYFLAETTRYFGKAPVYGRTTRAVRANIMTTTLSGRFADRNIRGTVTVRTYSYHHYVGFVIFDRPERFQTTVPRLLRSVRVKEYIGPW